MPGNIAQDCLDRLEELANRLGNDSDEISLNLETHSQVAETALEDFRRECDEFTVNTVSFLNAAKNLLQASLSLANAFDPINQLCEDISAIENLIRLNYATLRVLPEYPRISEHLTGLLNIRDSFYTHSPRGMLTELYGFVGQRIDLTTQLDDLLDRQESHELKDWWAIWNTDQPDFNHALRFASQPYHQRAMQLAF